MRPKFVTSQYNKFETLHLLKWNKLTWILAISEKSLFSKATLGYRVLPIQWTTSTYLHCGISKAPISSDPLRKTRKIKRKEKGYLCNTTLTPSYTVHSLCVFEPINNNGAFTSWIGESESEIEIINDGGRDPNQNYGATQI